MFYSLCLLEMQKMSTSDGTNIDVVKAARETLKRFLLPRFNNHKWDSN